MNAKLKRSILTTIFTLAAAAVILPTMANGQGKAIVGAWDLTITFRDCTTGAALRERPGIISFMFGGVMQEFGTGQQIPQNRTDAQGNWSHLNGDRYFAVSKAFRFNPDGSLAGTAKLFRTIELSDKDALAANVTSEIYDANGELVSRGCATESGTRLE